jgi:serine/threonine protein kinase
VLTDFGIAKTVGNETQLTSTGMTVGSAGYMSPEQARGYDVDNRSDLYSLGVLFWEMLTGGLPYHAQDPFALALKHATDPIPKLPGDRRQFQPVVEGLLAKKPENRLASAEELVRVIDEIPADDTRASAPSDPDATIVVPRCPKHRPSHPTVVTEADAQPPSAPKHRLGLVTTLTAIAGLAGIAGYFGYIGLLSPPPEAPPASPPAAPSSAARTETVSVPPDPKDRSEDQMRRASLPPAAVAESRDEQSAVDTPAGDAKKLPVASPADEQRDKRRSIAALLRQGEEQWKADRLIEPAGDNAFESYSKVLDLDSAHTEAKKRLGQIGRISAANKVFLSAESLLRQGEIDAARRMIETGLKMNPDDERLLGLERALDYEQ